MLLKISIKIFGLLCFVLFVFTANATNYYLSNSGNDANTGTDPSAPWQTLNKLNSFKNLKPGDNVLFNRGDTFYGSITISNSGTAGNPITFGAYGAGENPIITGFTNVTKWTNLGNNIWKSTDPVSTLSMCNMVVINGVNTAMGRWPNTTLLSYETHTGDTSITSSALTGTQDWTGAELAMYVTTYYIGRHPIIRQYEGTLNYKFDAGDGGIQNAPGYFTPSFFIQNDPRTLDTLNEWYYNQSTKKIDLYSANSPTSVQVSTIDTLINIKDNIYITFDNINLQGSNESSIKIYNSKYIIIQNCDFNFSGMSAISSQYFSNSSFIKIEHCSINHSNTSGIYIGGGDSTTIRFNSIKNSGMLPGMSRGGNGMDAQEAINIMESKNSLVEYNEIDSTGYIGICFSYSGNNIVIQNNFVKNSCLSFKDGAGIYADQYSNTFVSGWKILNNIVLNTDEGKINNDNGIYLDAETNGVEVAGNTVYNCLVGLFINNCFNIKIHYNNIFNCETAIYMDDYYFPLSNINVANNIFFVKNSTVNRTTYDPQSRQWAAWFEFAENPIPSTLTLDSNYFISPMPDTVLNFRTVIGPNRIYTEYSLSQWKSYSGQDTHSKKSPKAITNVNDLRFEYNATISERTIKLDANYMDVTGKTYNGTITLAPYTSVVLIKNGAIINQPPIANAGADQILTLPDNSVNLPEAQLIQTE
ncbi:MAG TPA: right-handed parallel beta-helix repeat-containing protein [Hanamia sp.]